MTDNTEKTRAAREEMDEKTEGLLLGLALTQLFSDAFGIKFEKEERVAYLKAREEHKKSFPIFTAWLYKDDCDRTDYGKHVNIFKSYLGLPNNIPIDRYTSDEVSTMNLGEARYDGLRLAGLDHYDALKKLDRNS